MARLNDEEICVILASRRYDNVVIRPQIQITEEPVRVVNVRVVPQIQITEEPVRVVNVRVVVAEAADPPGRPA